MICLCVRMRARLHSHVTSFLTCIHRPRHLSVYFSLIDRMPYSVFTSFSSVRQHPTMHEPFIHPVSPPVCFLIIQSLSHSCPPVSRVSKEIYSSFAFSALNNTLSCQTALLGFESCTEKVRREKERKSERERKFERTRDKRRSRRWVCSLKFSRTSTSLLLRELNSDAAMNSIFTDRLT